MLWMFAAGLLLVPTPARLVIMGQKHGFLFININNQHCE